MAISIFVFAILVILYAFRLSRRLGKSYPLWVCLASAVVAPYEPIGDIMAHVTFSATKLYFIDSFGVQVPLFNILGYVVFFGFPILYLISRLNAGMRTIEWMISFFVLVVIAMLFELPTIAMGVQNYYGDNQPFRIAGYPIWMAFVNVIAMFVSAAGAYLAASNRVFERWPVLLVPVVPLFLVGAHVTSGMPLALAINSPADVTTVNIAAVGSIFLATLYCWIAGQVVCRPRSQT